MKRIREIDLEAPVPEDDDGEDDGDDTCTSGLDERAFTKKVKWLHDIPQQGHEGEKQPRDWTDLYAVDSEKYQNAIFLDQKAQHFASIEIERHEPTPHTAKSRTVAPVDSQVPMDSDIPESGPQVDHVVDSVETPDNMPELGRQPVDKVVHMIKVSGEGVEETISKEHSVRLKEEKRTFCWPPAVLLYSINEHQDVELHSVLQKYVALLNQPDLNVRLEAVCLIGQYISLIYENDTRKAVTKMIQQQLWKEEEPSVIEALVNVLCSVAHISCKDILAEDENFDWASHVARLLLHYVNKKNEGSPLKSGLKLQLLRSLCLVGKAGAILELESVWPLAKEQIASPNPRLREYGIRVLVQSIKERKAGDGRNSEDTRAGLAGNVQRSRAEGESLMHTLLEYTRDPYPNVRETVVYCVLNLHSKGFALNHSTYKVAVALLRDRFESVRICAIKLIGVWAKTTVGDGMEGPDSKYIDNAFLQICNMITDMNMSVRQEACNVLAEMTGVSDSVLLQSLSKKVLTSSSTEKGSTGEGSSSMSNGDLDVTKLEEIKLLEWAAGAFVVAFEDEFWEVRSAAVMALAKLGLSSEKVAHSAVELIVDMINDDSNLVRQETIRALTNIAVAGRLSVLETHLHMFLGILEDSSALMRKGGHELLSAISLPSVAAFQLTVRAIFTSLDKHLEDEESLLVTLEKLGRSHASHTENLASELVQELRGLLNEDLGLDEPRSVGILVLLLGASTVNGKIISLIPSQILSIANLVSNKLPSNLPSLEVSPLGFKTVKYTWYATDAFLPSKHHSGDQSRHSQRKWRSADDSKYALGLVNLESWGQKYAREGQTGKDDLNYERERTAVLDIEGNQGAAWPSRISKLHQESRLYKSGEQKILESTKRIVGSALGTSLLLDMKAFKVVLQRLSGCRKELKALKGRCLGLSAMVSFYELYVECLLMVVQLRANFASPESRSLVTKSGLPQDVLSRLDSILKHILHRFSGFSFEHLLHILELYAVVDVWKLAVEPVGHPVNDGPVSMIFLELRLTVTTAEKLSKSHSLPHSPLLKAVLEQLLSSEGQTNVLNLWRAARQLALSYWPSQITVDPSLKETWASMKAPGCDFDHPVGFCAGLPLSIPIDVTLYNVPHMYALWIQFSQDTSEVGYKRIDDENSGINSASNVHQFSTLLQLDEMPAVASSVCRISIVIEGDNQKTLEKVVVGKGPKGCVVPICTEMDVHLYRIRERGSKQLPHGKR